MTFSWGVVHTVTPLTVKLDGSTNALPVIQSLVDPSSLTVGDMVRVELAQGGRVVVYGLPGGDSRVGVNESDIAHLSGRIIESQVDTESRSSGNTWTLGPTFDTISGLKPNSRVKVNMNIPTRNDSSGWGGAYIEMQVRINGGTWQSLGSTGYDGAVMSDGSRVIATYNQTVLIAPGETSAFSVQFRFYFKSYSGTVTWNNNHDINVISGTATRMSGANGDQNYAHIIVEEILA